MSSMIELTPVDMTPEVMQDLADRGLIIRLCPGAPMPEAAEGETVGESIYEAADSLGPHKLIAVTVNRETLAAFGTHVDNEEFLLIGDPSARPLYLVVALCRSGELSGKIAAGTLSGEDFVCLRVRYNDAAVSFFVMLADVPHGEAVGGSGSPATFYVTESRDMGIELTDFGPYRLAVVDGQ